MPRPIQSFLDSLLGRTYGDVKPSEIPATGPAQPLGNYAPKFLWQPRQDELITTRFMRNRVLFTTLAKNLAELRERKGAPLKILFWACSTGCEPYTLKFLLNPDGADEIIGIDQDASAIEKARQAVYPPFAWHTFFNEGKALLTPEELARYFEPAPDAAPNSLRVAPEYRRNITFLSGDLFAEKPCAPLKAFDLVVCNNLLLHLKPESAYFAWDYLYRYLRDDGLLVIAGCNPNVRRAAAKRLGLRPRPENLAEISRNWSGISGAWNFKDRPAWAFPEPDPSDPDYAYLAGEIFEKDSKST